ncbi:MAG: DNA recombination protein RmuC [Candidatus Delongbacteria bacterium]|jgi:DNA recombination protein RmuC|nr:DNA recombination protein RmuC [Candidatus Delongbacteria bacterium]
MTETLLVILTVLAVINLILFLTSKKSGSNEDQLKKIEELMIKFDSALERTEKSVKDEFARNRTEFNEISKSNREELTANTHRTNEMLRQKFEDHSKLQSDLTKQTTDNVKEIRDGIEKHLSAIREDNNKQLEEMRKTVDEKLQKTLNDRLSQSFETVGKQLIAVQEGLGEMRNIASDVGGLKKVLSNVKMRGGIGEIQLSMLLEQILAPEQYETNVKTKTGSSDLVEFAIKLPGKDSSGKCVWLPVDAKFPKDIYEKIVDANEKSDPAGMIAARKEMETAIKKMAKDISDKYIDPPNTTDFAIMFLPFESIYAEVVSNGSLLETLQRDCRIIVTGPSTLAALLNSLQMGFKTLAIEKRSSEVWKTLAEVKKEFGKFGDLMERAKKNIQTGLSQLEDVSGTRTNAIRRKLRDVALLDAPDDNSGTLFPEIAAVIPADEDD